MRILVFLIGVFSHAMVFGNDTFDNHFQRLTHGLMQHALSTNPKKANQFLDKVVGKGDGVYQKYFILWQMLYAAPKVRKNLLFKDLSTRTCYTSVQDLLYLEFINRCEEKAFAYQRSKPVSSKAYLKSMCYLFECKKIKDLWGIIETLKNETMTLPQYQEALPLKSKEGKGSWVFPSQPRKNQENSSWIFFQHFLIEGLPA